MSANGESLTPASSCHVVRPCATVLKWYPFISNPTGLQRQELSAGRCRRKPGRQRRSSRTVPLSAERLQKAKLVSSARAYKRPSAAHFWPPLQIHRSDILEWWSSRALKLRAVSTGLVPIRTSERRQHKPSNIKRNDCHVTCKESEVKEVSKTSNARWDSHSTSSPKRWAMLGSDARIVRSEPITLPFR